MLVRQGSHRNEKIDRGLAASLAAIAGALNASAFYAVGFFSANMTGNVSTLSDHLAVGQWLSALFYGGIVVAFVFSLAVGLFFGLYPANKASRLNPIDALRYE